MVRASGFRGLSEESLGDGCGGARYSKTLELRMAFLKSHTHTEHGFVMQGTCSAVGILDAYLVNRSKTPMKPFRVLRMKPKP